MTEFIMPLSFTKPPLTANQRFGHWAEKAKLVKQLRQESMVRARSMRLPTSKFATVTLHYQPRDRRRRDRHNLYPSVKALVDGLVDAKVVPDDDAEHLSAPEPVIHPAVKGEPGRCWLAIKCY